MFHLQPSHTTESHRVIVKLKSNQLLIIRNLEDFYPSAPFLDPIIIVTHFYQSLLVVVEVYLIDCVFFLADNAIDLGDLLVWVEGIT